MSSFVTGPSARPGTPSPWIPAAAAAATLAATAAACAAAATAAFEPEFPRDPSLATFLVSGSGNLQILQTGINS